MTKKKRKKAVKKAAPPEEDPVLDPDDDTAAPELEPEPDEDDPEEELDESWLSEEDEDKELAKIEADIEKKYGKGVVVTASKGKALDIEYFDTEILALNFTMGGGFPRSRVVMFIGDESGGKTSFAMIVAGAVQRCIKRKTGRWGRVLWNDAEGSWDNDWAMAMGMNIKFVKVVRTEGGQEGLDICRILLASGKFDLFGLDSIAALVPEEELAASMGQSLPGVQARMVNKFIRDIGSKMTKAGTDEYGPSFLLVNQVREKIGVMFGNPETIPGGKGQKFASSIEIRFGRGQYTHLREDGTPYPKNSAAPDGLAPTYVDMKWRSTKNKCLVGDSAVFDPVAKRVFLIEEGLDKFRLDVVGWDGRSLVQDQAETCIDQDMDDVIELTVAGVGKIAGNPDHRLLAEGGFKQFDEFRVGDLIPVPSKLDLPVTEDLSESRALLIGLLLGDGGVDGATGASLTTESMEVLNKFTLAVKEFDCEVVPKDGGPQYYVRREGGGHKGKPNPLYAWLRSIGMWGKRAWTKEIPSVVFGASTEAKTATVAGYLATDGWVEDDGKRIAWETCSQKLAEGLRVLLLMLGVRASVTPRPPRELSTAFDGYVGLSRGSWVVRANGLHASRLVNMLRWSGSKALPIAVTLPAIDPSERVPIAFAEAVIERAGGDQRELMTARERFGVTGSWKQILGMGAKTPRSARKDRVHELASAFGMEDLLKEIDKPVDWCRVTKIEQRPDREIVYDICGCGTETFLVNGLVSHNCFPPRVSSGCRLYLQDDPINGFKIGDVDEMDRLWQYGQRYGLIIKESGVWRCGKLRARKKPELREKLVASRAAQTKLKRALLERLLS